MAGHYGLPAGEVPFLLDRLQGPGELPVVLFVATRSGVSPEAVLYLRRRGWSWQRVLGRYEVEAGDLFLPLARLPGEGALARAYQAWLEAPPASRPNLTLPDAAIVSLVNLLFLADYLDLPPVRVASILAEHGSPVAAYRELLRGRLP